MWTILLKKNKFTNLALIFLFAHTLPHLFCLPPKRSSIHWTTFLQNCSSIHWRTFLFITFSNPVVVYSSCHRSFLLPFRINLFWIIDLPTSLSTFLGTSWHTLTFLGQICFAIARDGCTTWLWVNNSRSNSLRGSSASCVGLAITTKTIFGKFKKTSLTAMHCTFIKTKRIKLSFLKAIVP